MPHFQGYVAIGAALILSACGGGDTTAPASPDPIGSASAPLDGCDALDLPPPAPGEGIQVSIDMQLDAGQERQVCKLILASDDVNMNWSEGMFTKGSHHANVLSTSYANGVLPTTDVAGNTVDASTALDCESLASNYQVSGLLVARVDDARSTLAKGTLPDDVALKIAKNDVLELNFHMINTSENPVHACYKENLYSIPTAQVAQRAGVIFWYNNYIAIPAASAASATTSCPVTEDVNLVQQVAHMHARGVDYTASLLDGDPLLGSTSEVQQLYHTTNWNEPPAVVDSPPIPMKQGQWVKWSCGYQNTEARDIAQGQQTTDEMCMFIGLYWPESPQMDWCMGDKAAIPYMGEHVLGTGTMNGAEYADCWANSAGLAGLSGGGPGDAATRYAAQRCVTESCPNVSGQVNDALLGNVDITQVGCNP